MAEFIHYIIYHNQNLIAIYIDWALQWVIDWALQWVIDWVIDWVL